MSDYEITNYKDIRESLSLILEAEVNEKTAKVVLEALDDAIGNHAEHLDVKNARGLEDTVEGAKEHLLENIRNGATIEKLKTMTATFAYIVQDTDLEHKANVYIKALKQVEEYKNDNL